MNCGDIEENPGALDQCYTNKNFVANDVLGVRNSSVLLDARLCELNSVELFKKLNWLPLHLEVKVNICVQVYKRINGQSPSYMNDLLVLNSGINDRNSRNCSLNLVCPRFKRESAGGRTVV